MVRGSSNTLVRGEPPAQLRLRPRLRARRSAQASSTAVDNTIIEPKFNGIDVIGDSPDPAPQSGAACRTRLRCTSRTSSRRTARRCSRSRFSTTTTSATARSAEAAAARCRPVHPAVVRCRSENERRQHPVASAAGLAESARTPAGRHVAADHRRDPGRDRRAVVRRAASRSISERRVGACWRWAGFTSPSACWLPRRRRTAAGALTA